eukprot:1168407-Prorocentrum_minimum.AAC.1
MRPFVTFAYLLYEGEEGRRAHLRGHVEGRAAQSEGPPFNSGGKGGLRGGEEKGGVAPPGTCSRACRTE